MKDFSTQACADFIVSTCDTFIFSLSYEKRSLQLFEAVKGNGVDMIGFFNSNHDYIADLVSAIRGQERGCKFHPIDSDHPLKTFDTIKEVVGEISGHPSEKSICVDISCFTRESLAILVFLLGQLDSANIRVYLVYAKAQDYPQIFSNDKDAWFTKGVVDVRSVLGYRGNINLFAKTNLILLPGYEIERSIAIIEAIEPDRLTIGTISGDESIHPGFAERTEKMVDYLKGLYTSKQLNYFNFSAKDPFRTRQAIESVIDESFNSIIACLNTKIAMIGSCMAALGNQYVQLIYAQPMMYNTSISIEGSGRYFLFQIYEPPNYTFMC